jgi:hypothetical protein
LGLSDISVLSTLAGLQFLFLQALKRIGALPDLTSLKRLRKVGIESMHGLQSLHVLECAPSLEDIRHIDNRTISMDAYLPILRKDSLKRISVGFGASERTRVSSN